jgi:hypothetical protein
MKKKLILIIGVLAIFISCYNTIYEEIIKSSLVIFLLGIGFILSYFESVKLKELRIYISSQK